MINTKAIKKKKCDFLFDSMIILIKVRFRCIAKQAILTHSEDEKKMNKESLLILFCFVRDKFQQSFYSPQTPIY